MNDLIASYSRKSVAIPGPLRDQIEQFRVIPNELKSGWRATFVPNAEVVADALEAEHFSQAPHDVIAAWLLDLEQAVVPTLSAEQVSGRISVIVSVLGDQPAYCWTRDAFIGAAKTFRFFPTVAELADFQAAIIAHRRLAISIARSAAKAVPPHDEPREPVPPYVVTSTPEWVGKHGPHFNPKPEREELAELMQDPVRTVEDQLKMLGFNSPDEVPKIR